MTMAVGAALGLERLGGRKSLGVLIAVGGVVIALGAGLRTAPDGAWQGDLIMAGATFCMALYSVYSRPFAGRASPMGVLTVGMAAGGIAMVVASIVTGGAGSLGQFGPAQWLAAAYLAAGGGALAFLLWVYALQLASPTQVANTMTVNPFVATLLAAGLLGEPITVEIVVGLVAVVAGLWIATTSRQEGKD
jgi:drug/metabolite transporter (DMT)-like permease